MSMSGNEKPRKKRKNDFLSKNEPKTKKSKLSHPPEGEYKSINIFFSSESEPVVDCDLEQRINEELESELNKKMAQSYLDEQHKSLEDAVSEWNKSRDNFFNLPEIDLDVDCELEQKIQEERENEIEEKKGREIDEINKRYQYYENFFKKYESDIKNCEDKFDQVMKKYSRSLTEDKPDIDRMMAEFRKDWQTNLDDKIKCYDLIVEKIDQNQEFINGDYIFELKCNNLLAIRESSLGVNEILSGNLAKAKNHFKKAIKFEPGLVLPQLWLVITYYRLKKYSKAIKICDNALSGSFLEVSLEKVSPIYLLFPILQDEIEKHDLNFTHQNFCYSEFYYYRALSIKGKKENGWESGYKACIAITFLLRGNNCFYNQSYKNAILCYDESLKNDPHYAYVHYRLGLVYYAIGEQDKSFSSFDNCLKKVKPSKEKASYLSTILELKEKTGSYKKINLWATEIVEIDCPIPIKIKGLAYKIKVACLSLNTTCSQEVMGFFNKIVDLYLGSSEVEKQESFAHYNQSINNVLKYFTDLYKKYNNIDTIIDCYEKILETDCKIIGYFKNSAKNFGTSKNKYFPNWIYDRLYMKHISLFILHYHNFYLWYSSLNEKFKPNEKVGKIKEKFEQIKKFINSVVRYEDNIDINEKSGWSIDDLKKLLDLLTGSENDKSESESKEEFDAKSVLDEYDDLVKDQEPDLKSYGIKMKKSYENSRKHLELCVDREKELIFGNEFFLLHYHNYLMIRVVMLNIASFDSCLDHKSGEKNNFIYQFRKYYDVLQKLLEEYKDIAEKNDNKISRSQQEAYITFFEKNLCLIVLDTYLNWLENDKIRLIIDPSNLIQKCKKIFTIIEKHNKKPDHDYILYDFFDASLRQNQNYLAIFKRISELNYEALWKRYLNQHKQLARDPLAVIYGEESKENSLPLVVPFPHQMLQTRIEDVRKKHNIRSSANVSIHSMTIIFSNNESKETKEIKEIIHMPIIAITEEKSAKDNSLIHYLTFDKVGSERKEKEIEESIFGRISAGHRFLSEKPDNIRYSFFNKNNPPTKIYNPFFHRHSEQHYFEYLSQIEITAFIGQLTKLDSRFNSRSRVHAIIHDMVSDKISCNNCKLAETAELQCEESYKSFAKKFWDYLKQHHQQQTSIKVAARISANSNQSGEYYAVYPIPQNKNLKLSDELLIFECVKPVPAISGSSGRIAR